MCADSSGVFFAELTPRAGINVVTVGPKESPEEFAWTFGWGKAISPFGSASGAIELGKSAAASISSDAIRSVIVPFVNNYLKSDEFKKFAEGFGASSETGAGLEKSAEEIAVEGGAEPYLNNCESAGKSSGLITSFGSASVGAVRIGDLEISDGVVSLSVFLEDLRALLFLSPDANKDGVGDKNPLPLTLGLKKARLNLIVEVKDDAVVIGSPHTDCDYKDKGYCAHSPAVLIVDNLEGNATLRGSIVYCDVERAAPEAKEACLAINSLNAQTAVIAEKVLDSINQTIHCEGSRAATRLANKRAAIRVPLGCADAQTCQGALALFDSMELPLAVQLGGIPKLGTTHLEAFADIFIGDQSYFSDVPKQYRQSLFGAVSARLSGEGPNAKRGDDLGLALSLDIVNSVLYAASARGDGREKRGVLDFDIHEKFFERFAFDFVEECDAFIPVVGVKEKPSALCYIRPRVMELLGSALTAYGYFPPKQPLMLSIRGNRALGPRISVSRPDDVPSLSPEIGDADDVSGRVVELELGGVLMSFYALEVDEQQGVDSYGNLPVKIGPDQNPLIRSMRPESPDPWDGPIVSFDLTLLLAVELGDMTASESVGGGYEMKARILSDRTRIVVSPVIGSNVTTIPPKRLISNLTEQIMTALTQYSSKESAFTLKVPQGFEPNGAAPELFSRLGIKSVKWGEGGLTLALDEGEDEIYAGVSAVIEQVIHENGVEKIIELR